MPCDCDGYPSTEDRLREELDAITRLLCMACQSLGTFQAGSTGNPELQAWWEVHQEADRKRLAREKAEADDLRNRRIAKMKNNINAMDAKASAYRAELEKLEGKS